MQTDLVSSASASSATSASAISSPSNVLGKDAFLKLLVAQLQHQDPTKTTDTDQMVQQMTGFSSLEQLQNMNGLLQGIQAQNAGIFQAQATNLVGKHVRINSSSFDLKDSKATIGVQLEGTASVTLKIKDANGKVVATLEKGTLTQGSHMIDWDGKDASGTTLADGSYTVEVIAKDSSGKAVTASTSIKVLVDSLRFINGVVYIVASGRTVSLSDITEITS